MTGPGAAARRWWHLSCGALDGFAITCIGITLIVTGLSWWLVR